MPPSSPMSGTELWNAPEFVALCKLLGIPRDEMTAGVTIRLDISEPVLIEHTFYNRPRRNKVVEMIAPASPPEKITAEEETPSRTTNGHGLTFEEWMKTCPTGYLDSEIKNWMGVTWRSALAGLASPPDWLSALPTVTVELPKMG